MSDHISGLDATELGTSAGFGDAPHASELAPERGQVIGRFVVLDVLGTGGMGVVYAAYDPHLDRKVALKLLRTQVMGSEEARARMLREAQAMARIDHPNVLRVHEAGTFGDQIYIAMEFAAGGTLRTWLAAKRRSPREIVDMFIEAGRGLAAAHAAGLVHRDFKPDNVLLLEDGRVRVTDFGIVGVVGELQAGRPPELDTPISDTTPLSQDLTRTGALMGTPSYMAPEQFRGGLVGHGVDQFAFCVALYEALYGKRPFAGATFAELCANVVAGEVIEPPRDTQVPSRFARVVMRGLATDSAQRYPGMAALLAELAPERSRRWVWLAAAAAVAVVGGVVAVFELRPAASAACSGSEARLATAWSPLQRGRLSEGFATSHRPYAHATLDHTVTELDRWGDTWKHAYVGACEDTRVRAIQSDHLLDLRMECLSRALDETRTLVDALAAGGDDAVDHAITAAERLPATSACADTAALTAAIAPPTTGAMKQAVEAVRTKLYEAIAQRRLGHYKAGRAIAEAALVDARASGFAPMIARATYQVGVFEFELADRAATATLRDAMHQALAVGDDKLAVDAAGERISDLATDPKRFSTADEIAQVATAVADHGKLSASTRVGLLDEMCALRREENRLDDAQKLCDEAMAIATKQFEADDSDTVTTINRLAILAAARHRYDDELRLFKQVATLNEHKYGPDHIINAGSMDNLASAYDETGKLGDEKQIRERALAIRIATLGPDHPDVALSYEHFGGMYATVGDHAKAKGYYEQALAIYRKAYGDDSVLITSTLTNLGSSLGELGDQAGARTVLEHALAIDEKTYAPDDPRLLIVLTNLGSVAKADHRFDDALGYYGRVRQIATKAFGPNDPQVADSVGNTADTYTTMGKLVEARAATTQTMELMAKIYGPKSPRMGMALVNDAALRLRMQDPKGALASCQQALVIFESTLGKTHPAVAAALVEAADALNQLGRQTEAVPLAERALAIATAVQLDPNDVGEINFALADALVAKPSNRARARALATTALADYQQANKPADVAKMKRWLATH